jgi:hypothetical protein
VQKVVRFLGLFYTLAHSLALTALLVALIATSANEEELR